MCILHVYHMWSTSQCWSTWDTLQILQMGYKHLLARAMNWVGMYVFCKKKLGDKGLSSPTKGKTEYPSTGKVKVGIKSTINLTRYTEIQLHVEHQGWGGCGWVILWNTGIALRRGKSCMSSWFATTEVCHNGYKTILTQHQTRQDSLHLQLPKTLQVLLVSDRWFRNLTLQLYEAFQSSHYTWYLLRWE